MALSEVKLNPVPSPKPIERSILAVPYLYFKRRSIMVDGSKSGNIERAADELAEGGVIISNIVGAIGFIIDGQNENAIDKVLSLKGRGKGNPLIIGGSATTRDRLVDRARVPKDAQLSLPCAFDLPHFFEMPIKNLPDGVGMVSDCMGRIGAIFWANFYQPMVDLEEAIQKRDKEAFLGGSSANLHGRPNLTTARAAYDLFAQNGGIKTVLVDRTLEKNGFFSGSHVMLGFGEAGSVKPYRPGPIALDSFREVYPNLSVPENWQEKGRYVSVADIRQAGSYSKLHG